MNRSMKQELNLLIQGAMFPFSQASELGFEACRNAD